MRIDSTSGYPVYTDVEQADMDKAHNRLEEITRYKRGLTCSLRECFPGTGIGDLYAKLNIEEMFDDRWTPEWRSLTAITGDLEWTLDIPSCDKLEAMAKERIQKEKEAMERLSSRRMLSAPEIATPLPNAAMSGYRVGLADICAED